MPNLASQCLRLGTYLLIEDWVAYFDPQVAPELVMYSLIGIASVLGYYPVGLFAYFDPQLAPEPLLLNHTAAQRKSITSLSKS